MTSMALPTLQPLERNNMPLSIGYSLALHILLVALLGALCTQTALNSPAELEMVVVGLVPVARVNLGQSNPTATTAQRNPVATVPTLSAPSIDQQSVPQQVVPQVPDQPQTPRLLTLATPDPFTAPSQDRQQSQMASRQQTAGERRNGQQTATAPLRGPGANLPVHEAPQISATLQTAPNPVTMPQFNASAPVTNVPFAENPAMTPNGPSSVGVITSTRKLIPTEPPPVPEELQQSGIAPVFRFKVLINPAGDIVEATVYQRSSFPQYEEKLRQSIKAEWRYERGVGYEWRIIECPVKLTRRAGS